MAEKKPKKVAKKATAKRDAPKAAKPRKSKSPPYGIQLAEVGR